MSDTLLLSVLLRPATELHTPCVWKFQQELGFAGPVILPRASASDPFQQRLLAIATRMAGKLQAFI
eukprot:scaffold321372_cov17-Tisochrysis_lutea.AAC.1